MGLIPAQCAEEIEMSNVIQKYVKLGVLNYVDHETPRHYFLWDGIMEEEPSRVHSVVEELCDESIKLLERIKELEKQLEFERSLGDWM